MKESTDLVTAYYGTRFTDDERRSAVWREVCLYLKEEIPAEGCVLELGAGYCSFINQVSAREKHAVDIYPGLPKFASPEVETHVGSCEDLSYFHPQFFDVVLASNLLEHLTPQATARTLSEVRRVLKNDGKLIVVQPNYRYCFREYFDDFTHIQVFTHISLRDLLLANAFIPEKIEPRFLPATFKSRLPKWWWLVRLYLRLPIRPFAGQMLFICRRNPNPDF